MKIKSWYEKRRKSKQHTKAVLEMQRRISGGKYPRPPWA